MTRILIRRADALHAAGVERWRAAWEAFWTVEMETPPLDAFREWEAERKRLETLSEAERTAAAEAHGAAFEAVAEELYPDAEKTPEDRDRLALWATWWEREEAVTATLCHLDADSVDLSVWPTDYPPTPEPATERERAETRREVEAFRAAAPGSPRRLALAHVLCACGMIAAVRSVHPSADGPEAGVSRGVAQRP